MLDPDAVRAASVDQLYPIYKLVKAESNMQTLGLSRVNLTSGRQLQKEPEDAIITSVNN